MKFQRDLGCILLMVLIAVATSCGGGSSKKDNRKNESATDVGRVQIIFDDSIAPAEDIDTAMTVETLKSNPDALAMNKEYLLLFDYLKLDGDHYVINIDEKKARELGVRKEAYDHFVFTYNELNKELDKQKESGALSSVWHISTPRKLKAEMEMQVKTLQEISNSLRN